MNVFEAVKQSVTTRQAAEHYGIHVGRNGMACCPFHNDKTPSMKLDQRYHCFGCGADGKHVIIVNKVNMICINKEFKGFQKNKLSMYYLERIINCGNLCK